MKLFNFVLIIFFVWGALLPLQNEASPVKIKTILKMAKKAPAALIKINKIVKLPKLPIKPLTDLQRSALKNVLGIKDNLSAATWGKVEESIGFFVKIGKFLKNRNISTFNLKDPLEWREDEFMICKPNTHGYSCNSHCQLAGESYKWCYLKGGSYDFCSCQIRTPMKYWIVFMKKHFDRILKDMNPELKEVVKPIVETIKTIDYDPDSKQWVVIAVLSIIMSVFVLGIASRMIFNYMKVKKAILDTEDETGQENQPENA